MNPASSRMDRGSGLRSARNPHQMALNTCPDCGNSISSLAVVCPRCGRPTALAVAAPQSAGRVCPNCGSSQVSKVRGLQGGGEVLTCALLFFLGIVPGIVYYISTESTPFCSGCGRRVRGKRTAVVTRGRERSSPPPSKVAPANEPGSR
jgi:ribosomal protein L32